MYRLKQTASRLTAFVAAVGLLGTMSISMFVLPTAANADSLNPLTQRSLTLSSSSPGWSYTDGSGDPWDISCFTGPCDPGFSPYASPGSGANGQKTGETFSFKVSTDSSATGTNTPVDGMSFQYCTTSAGQCLAPGDDAYTGSSGSYLRGDDTSTTSDLNVVLNSPTEVTSGNIGTYVDLTTGNMIENVPPTDSAGSFAVLYKDSYGSPSSWSLSPGWSESTTNLEDGTVGLGTATGKNNFIQLVNSGGGLSLHSDGAVKIIFFGTNDNYITNPGSDAFFVKINDYTNDTTGVTSSDAAPADTTAIVDGGVTVANVMNQSIQIETKVLETMDFSVGTVDPDNLTGAALATATSTTPPAAHGICDPILTTTDPGNSEDPSNFLYLGNPNAENSLSTSQTYGTYSYFRLSSNSTGGATVYYAGTTLSDTEGDQITPMGYTPNSGNSGPGTVVATAPHVGSPQFGLALDNDTNPADNGTSNEADSYDSAGTTEAVNDTYNNHTDTGGSGLVYDYETGADGLPSGVDTGFTSAITGNASAHDPQLYPLVPVPAYADGTGIFNATHNTDETSYPSVDTEFAFDGNANNVPAPIATESTAVVNCITGKVRYIANIAATTPAGIFTTKINYIASPQY